MDDSARQQRRQATLEGGMNPQQQMIACPRCGNEFPRHGRAKYCRDACRQAVHRQSPARKARKDRFQAELRQARIERNRARSLNQFGFYSGPISKSVGFPRKERR